MPPQDFLANLPNTSIFVPVIQTSICDLVLAKINALYFDGKQENGLYECRGGVGGNETLFDFGGSIFFIRSVEKCQRILKVLADEGFAQFDGCYPIPPMKYDGSLLSDVEYSADAYTLYFADMERCTQRIAQANPTINDKFIIVKSDRRIDAEQSTEDAYTAVNMTARNGSESLACYVDTPVMLRPYKLDLKKTKPSTGCVDNITFSLESNANGTEGLFVHPNTGVIVGSFSKVQPTTFTLIAADSSGAKAVVEHFEIEVQSLPKFKINTSAINDRNSTLVVEEYHKWKLATNSKDILSVSRGNKTEVTYTLQDVKYLVDESNLDEAPNITDLFVAPDTGDVAGVFETPGQVSFTVTAIDAGSATHKVETITVTVNPKPKFEVFDTGKRASVPEGQVTLPINETGPTKVLINDPYRIAPLELNKSATKVTGGGIDDIIYTLDGSGAPFFYIQPLSGIIFGSFPDLGNFNVTINCQDALKEEDNLETLQFNVVKPAATFKPVFKETRKRFNEQEPATPKDTYIVDELYTISPKELDDAKSEYTSGINIVTYKLETAQDWYISSKTGEIFGKPKDLGTYKMIIYVVDVDGIQVVSESFTFNVIKPPSFAIPVSNDIPGCDSSRLDFGELGDYSTRTLALNESYLIPSCQWAANETVNVSKGSKDNITFSLVDAPESGFFVNSKTGEISCTFVTEYNDDVEFQLIAQDAGGEQIEIEEFVFKAKRVDTTIDTNGPGGKACKHGTTVDSTKFDGAFTCNCNTFYKGDNCDDFQPRVCRKDQTLVSDECKTFFLEVSGNKRTMTATDSKYHSNPQNETFYEIDQSYRIAPLDILNTTEVSQGDISQITYSLQASGENAITKLPDGFFIDPVVGEFTFKFNAEQDGEELIVQVIARDNGGAIATVETFTMNVSYPDSHYPKRGPNGVSCGEHGKTKDTNKFDGIFECTCNDGFIGQNCETNAALAASKDKGTKTIVTIVTTLASLLIVIVAVSRWRIYVISMTAHDFKTTLTKMSANGEIDINNSLTPREINRNALTLVDVVGSGQFGRVWKGTLDESSTGGGTGVPSYLVAAKTVKNSSSHEATEELHKEAAVMAQVSHHPNLVSLVGVITRGDPLVLIISYCEHGSLLSLLRSRAEEHSPLSLEVKMQLGLHIAKGMDHLANLFFIHRDLAARNVLVATGMIGQVADFGLSRGVQQTDSDGTDDLYYRSKSGVFPIRSTAPESMNEETRKFSSASDVWSFAIVMVEMYQDGKRPYPYIAETIEVMHEVIGGHHHKDPGGGCSAKVYDMLQKCWSREPQQRPSFGNLVEMMSAFHDEIAGSSTSSNSIPEKNSSSTAETSFVGSSKSLEYITSLYSRVVASHYEEVTKASPLANLTSTPLVSLKKAVDAAAKHSPCKSGFVAEVIESLTFAQTMIDKGKNLGLNLDQIASIHFYTQDCGFYVALNGALGGWGVGGQGAAQHYMLYCKLAIDSLKMLPKVSMEVFRGVQTVPFETLLGGKKVNDILTWHAFTSTTGTPDVLRSDAFFGTGTNARTVFRIQVVTGVRVKGFSAFGNGSDYYKAFIDQDETFEDEVLLLPGTTFRITGIQQFDNGVTEVRMLEVVRDAAVDVQGYQIPQTSGLAAPMSASSPSPSPAPAPAPTLMLAPSPAPASISLPFPPPAASPMPTLPTSMITSSTEENGGAAAVEAERCPQCKGKTAFCVCNVRRNTSNQPKVRRVPVRTGPMKARGQTDAKARKKGNANASKKGVVNTRMPHDQESGL